MTIDKAINYFKQIVQAHPSLNYFTRMNILTVESDIKQGTASFPLLGLEEFSNQPIAKAELGNREALTSAIALLTLIDDPTDYAQIEKEKTKLNKIADDIRAKLIHDFVHTRSQTILPIESLIFEEIPDTYLNEFSHQLVGVRLQFRFEYYSQPYRPDLWT